MSPFKALCAISLAASVGTGAPAAVFTFAGAFKPATGASYTTLLGGGSFDGYFKIAGASFPVSGTTTATDFSFNLRDSAGTIRKTISQGIGGASGYVSTDYVSYYGGIVINFQDPTANYLQLIVPTGFSGTGAVLANGNSYAQIAPMNQASVTSGRVTALPEPGSWAMMVGGFGLLGAAMRSRRTAVVSFG